MKKIVYRKLKKANNRKILKGMKLEILKKKKRKKTLLKCLKLK
jgi:hypothetical protein